jgi:transposase InsO family protein
MTDQQQAVQLRQQAIKLWESGIYNVTQICALLGRSRTWFYKWIQRHRQLGPPGLQNQIRWVCPVNRTPLDLEGQVLTLLEQFPSYGPQRIALIARQMNIAIGKTAVFGVMKRYSLNHRQDRLEWVRKLHGEVIKLSDLETARQKAKHRHIQADNPGDLVCLDLFYVGCLKGLGRIYQMTACDAATSFAWAQLYTDKSAGAAQNFLTHILQNAHGVKVTRILTDNGKEFTTHWRSKNHLFERTLQDQGIQHRYTQVKHPWTNGFVERLNRTILEEFYQVALRKKIYNTLEELQFDLDQFLSFYNFNRPHQGYRLKGRCPAELFCTLQHAA